MGRQLRKALAAILVRTWAKAAAREIFPPLLASR